MPPPMLDPKLLRESPETVRTAIARKRRYQRFQCNNCGAWFSGDRVEN